MHCSLPQFRWFVLLLRVFCFDKVWVQPKPHNPFSTLLSEKAPDWYNFRVFLLYCVYSPDYHDCQNVCIRLVQRYRDLLTELYMYQIQSSKICQPKVLWPITLSLKSYNRVFYTNFSRLKISISIMYSPVL